MAKISESPLNPNFYIPSGNSIYGFSDEAIDPHKIAPKFNKNGGVIFFGMKSKEKIKNMFDVLEIDETPKDYCIIEYNSEQPQKDGFLKQTRIITPNDIPYFFHNYNQEIKTIKINPQDFLYDFMDEQAKIYGTTWMKNNGLYGKFGGDGHWTTEELSFGFMIENSYYGIYRIWSRAWLVTK